MSVVAIATTIIARPNGIVSRWCGCTLLLLLRCKPLGSRCCISRNSWGYLHGLLPQGRALPLRKRGSLAVIILHRKPLALGCDSNTNKLIEIPVRYVAHLLLHHITETIFILQTLDFISGNIIWSILSELIEAVGVLHYGHPSLHQVTKLDGLKRHCSCGYEKSTERSLELLLGETSIGMHMSPVIMPPTTYGLLELVSYEVHLHIICSWRR